MHEFTMDTISRIALGQTESRQFQNEFTKIIIDLLNGGSRFINNIAWVCPLLGPIARNLGMLRSRLRKQGITVLLDRVQNVVEERKRQRVGFNRK
jgi:hypothetical protein